jgi:3-methyl-2-oxobutanoate hydroxymethyltransferase
MYLPQLLKKAESGERLVALTCYDASFARILVKAGVDILLVGDSLGMAIHGHDSTLPVTVDDITYHTAAVRRGAPSAFVMADMPFGSYQSSPAEAFANAARLLAAGANMVKLEGGAVMVDTVAFLVQRGIPVCAHLGLLPQSVNQTGYRTQARESRAAQQLITDATALEGAGASLLVLESIPALLAAEVSTCLRIPTIGIGAGASCDGQVLVLNDLLGLTERPPRFARNFMAGAQGIEDAVSRYVSAVRDGTFPAPEHSV